MASPAPQPWDDELFGLEDELRRAVLAAIRAAAAVSGDVGLATYVTILTMAAALGTLLQPRAEPAYQRAFMAGVQRAYDALHPTARLGYGIGRVNPHAVTFARRNAANLVTAIGTDVRRAINELVTTGLRTGTSYRDLAQAIRPMVGLTVRDARAAWRLRQRLVEAGRTPKQVEDQVNLYTRRLMRARALTIARTEIVRAANAGQVELWRDAAVAGHLDLAKWEKAWVVAADERLCPQCQALSGKRAVAPDGLFAGLVSHPPLHPRCRCTVVLRPKGSAL